MKRLNATWLATLLSLVSAPGWAEETETSTAAVVGLEDPEYLDLVELELEPEAAFDEILVTAERPTTAASAGVVRARDFLLRPRRRPADLLEVTPGLKVVQHAGGGKANQYFIRGFDADHGTDLALSMDGVPVNMVSHGQGYADLHFVIPEIVERIEIKKGPYFAELGDFATAGGVNLVTKRSVQRNSVSVAGGMFDTYRAVAAVSPELGNAANLFAGEVYTTNGPFESGEDLKRFNLFGRSGFSLFGGDLTVTLTGYGADWNASGQLPDREVAAGRLSRFGAVDPTEGGSSTRFNGYVQYQRGNEDGVLVAHAYVARYQLQLFSNFTFFSRNPIDGDMIEQTDERILAGGDAAYTFFSQWDAIELETTFGLETRTDVIDNGLFESRRRERLETVVGADVTETSLSAYLKEEIAWTSWLRTNLGVRGDFFNFDVRTRGREDSKQAGIVSPKADVIVSPLNNTDLFANFGMGFHSNDARGVVREEGAVKPLTRAIGYELGARTRLFDRLDVATSLFLLDLESEIVFVGDEGTTEASGRTRRMGVEAEARLELLSWLYADADLTLTRARFRDAPSDEDEIPLAPRLTVSGGLSALHPAGVFGRLSLFHLADRPASEDGFITALGYTKMDATVGYRTEDFELALTMQNLLDQDIREAQFATTSRLPDERAGADCGQGARGVTEDGRFVGCEDLHFTPGPPLSAQASLSVFF